MASLLPALDMEEVSLSTQNSMKNSAGFESTLKYLIPIYLKFCQSVYTIYIKNTGSWGF